VGGVVGPWEAWLELRPKIAEALRLGGGTHAIEDVEAGIASGLFPAWISDNAAVVGQVWREPRGATLNLWLVAGDLAGALKLLPDIEHWARANGVGRMVGGGLARKRGWERLADSRGFQARWTVYAKELK
jgi:hypothetical protein